MGWIEGLIHLPFGSGAVSQSSSSLPNNIPAHIQTNSSNSGSNKMMQIAYPAGLVNNNQNDFGCNCKSGYTGMPAQLNSGVSNMTVNYPQGTYFTNNGCACIPTSSMSQLVNPSNNISLSKALGLKQLPPVYETNSSTSGGNNIMNTQSSTNTTASASSSSPVAPIQNLMNNWFAWGVQPTNAAGNEPTNTKAALNTMTNQWQFFPSQNAGNSISANTASTNITSTANPTSQAQTALSNATSTASANASPQASNGLSDVAQEFEKAIESIFGSISNFVKNL